MATLELRSAAAGFFPIRLSVLVIGDAQSAEFRAAFAGQGILSDVLAETPSENAPQLDMQSASCVAQALDQIETGHCLPDLIILAQTRPGEFSLHDVDLLRRAAPSARFSGLLGSWCEGEARSGTPWPGVMRTYWHQWPARFEAEIATLAAGRCPAWGMADTTAEDERLLASADDLPPQGCGLIAICSEDREMYGWLEQACRSFGYATLRISDRAGGAVTTGGLGLQLGGLSAAVWDGGGTGSNRFVQLEAYAAIVRPAPVVGLLSFPRIEDHERALAAGAAAVLSKPLLLADLARVLRQSIATSP